MKLRRYRKTKNNLYYYQFIAEGGVIIGENEEGYEEREIRDKQFQLILKYGVNDKNIIPKTDAKNKHYFDVVDKKGNTLLSSIAVDAQKDLDQHRECFVEALRATAGIRPRKATDAEIAQKKKSQLPLKPKNALLQLIEGVGPKSEQALNIGGVETFEDLAKSEQSNVRAMLSEAGLNTGILNFDNWIQQAAFAAKNDWQGLRKLQLSVGGGNYAKVDKFERQLGVKIIPEVDKVDKFETKKEDQKDISKDGKYIDSRESPAPQAPMSSSSVLDQETPNRAGTTTAVAGVVGSAIMLNRDPANNNKTSDVEYNIVLEEEAERESIEVKAEALARSTWQNESRGESAIEESTVKKSDGGESTVKKSAVEEHIVEGAKGEVVHTSDENSDLSSALNKEGVEIDSGGSASDAESILPSESAETQTITPIADSASSPSNAKVSTENNSTSTKRIHWMWWIVLLFLLSFLGWFIIG